MKLDGARAFLGDLPGAGGSPVVGLVYLLSLATGAGLIKFMFYSVRKNERGVWLRLGNPVHVWFTNTVRILRPGRPGIRFPFIWRLVKVSVNLRTNRTEDIETTRCDDAFALRQKWIIKCDVNWRVQTSGFRVVRAAIRADDLEETVMAIVTNGLRSSLYDADVGAMETDRAVLADVKRRCAPKLAGLGVAVSAINIIKYAPVDAQILANSIERQPLRSSTNGNGHKVVTGVTPTD